MKQNTWFKILAAGTACVIGVSTAFGQTTTSVTTVEGTNAAGVFTAAPGSDYFMLRGETGAPVRYYYTPQTTVVDETGAPVAWKTVSVDTPATVYYDTTGDRMVVKKVVVRRKVPAGGVIEHKETTTTTTTTTRP